MNWLRLIGLGSDKLAPALCVRCGCAGVLGRDGAGLHLCGGDDGAYGRRSCSPANLRRRAYPALQEWAALYNGADIGLLAAALDPRVDEDISIGDLRVMWRRVKQSRGEAIYEYGYE